ncbi:MAG: MnmC family methyltransferase [Cyanobacteriota bacterium]|nr:MnmC family methyltransferase [Cyanobacteriota bacterium]
MSEIQPYFTNDGSLGLYNSDFNDIYHSATGALTEAYDKFVYPADFDTLLLHDNIKILDICHGIGYNTKAFLNFIYSNKNNLHKRKIFVRKNFCKNNYMNKDIDTIHTDNKPPKNHQYNIELIHTDKNSNFYKYENINTIYTDNIFDKVSVTALDNDEILFGLSPFVKTGCKNFEKDSEIISEHHLNKYFKIKNSNKPKIENFINYIIFDQILKNNPEIYQNSQVLRILSDKKYRPYFADRFKEFNICSGVTEPKTNFLSFLHNIYYLYVTKCYKKAANSLKIGDFIFKPKIADARSFIIRDKNKYNLIFLDAFTPKKCPCLWSYDFFKALFNLLEDDGMLLTYSSSACVRSAMKSAGFCIGYNYNKRFDKFDGTIATKNQSLIKYPLSEFDLGLLNTRAGIFYRDENLTSQNEAIINARETEVQNSNKKSATQYIKHFNK